MEYITEIEPTMVSSTKKEKKKTISEKECNSCKYPLPKLLDNGICPICGRRN
jgi:rRNA maturation endonuclease Nob1